MALAQLFYLREAIRRHARSLRNGWARDRRPSSTSRTSPRVASTFQIEPLEERLLLSATPLYTAADASQAVDLTLTVQAQDGAETLMVVDNGTQAVLASVDLSTLPGDEQLSITGSAYDDRVTIDASVLNATIRPGLLLDGGGGADQLLGPSQDLTWSIVASDAGSVGNVTFTNIANLIGAADNQDTFVFEVGGSLSGTIDGGAGGFDTLVVNGTSFETGVFSFTNSNDGTVDLTGTGLISYIGLEPITVTATIADVICTFAAVGETITLSDYPDPNWMQVSSTAGETVKFLNPTNSLTINAGGGNDTVVITSVDAAFNASLIINGDGGNDTINLNAYITFAAGKNLDVNLTNDATAGDADTINVGTNANLRLTGAGVATLQVSRNIAFASQSSVVTVDGNLTLSANQQSTATVGSFIGVNVNNGFVGATGTGVVTVQGRGGTVSTGGGVGVRVQAGGKIFGGTSGLLTVQGTGGATSSENRGVIVEGFGSQITSNGANVSVIGVGRGTGGSFVANDGVNVWSNGVIKAGGSGTVTVHGTSGAGGGRMAFTCKPLVR